LQLGNGKVSYGRSYGFTTDFDLTVRSSLNASTEAEAATVPSYVEQSLQEMIPAGSLHVSANPEFAGVVAKNERGTHPKKLGGGGGGASARRASPDRGQTKEVSLPT
jgi:hypothetical protein